jgi:CheY-like chemotaxis protein
MGAKVILIVEDNLKNRKLARDLLQFHGYVTLEADDGQAGIQLACDHTPDLILMDIQLPGVDGQTAMQALKHDVRTADIPIIAFTALAMKGDKERLLASGFDGYIDKPIDIKTFPAAIARYLRKES